MSLFVIIITTAIEPLKAEEIKKTQTSNLQAVPSLNTSVTFQDEVKKTKSTDAELDFETPSFSLLSKAIRIVQAPALPNIPPLNNKPPSTQPLPEPSPP
ncbi:hypothetical protein CBP16_01605, partial [Fischerella thermalis WC217]